MLKRTGRRDNNRFSPVTESGGDMGRNNSETGDQTSQLLAEMARGMLETQSKVNELSSNVNASEIKLLLEKISSQLANFNPPQNTSTGSPNNSNPESTVKAANSGQENNATEAQQPSAPLENLFAKLLMQGSNNSSSDSNSSQQEQKRPNNTEYGSEKIAQQMAKDLNEGNEKLSQKMTQTAAQVLAQAQYELSNELENSLKKLKQVISESEKIAARISNLLGEDANRNKS